MMQSDIGESTKVNLQAKLCLKRSNSDSCKNSLRSNSNGESSSNVNNYKTCINEQLPHNKNVSRSPNHEDSLADFKSPKKVIATRPLLNKFKVDAEKVTKKVLKSKSKTNTKSRKSISDINQPSIESSFFKPQTSNQNDIKQSFPCPLCLRPFKDDLSCTNHMKNCASKNKVSIKQLLDAKKLQDRQLEERKAMGLLATPALPERKKIYRSKNYSTEDDPQLQLVLAMSESLYEAEQIKELEQAALLAGIPAECIKEMNEEERRTTLQNFGFTTNKPVTEVTANKSRRKKLLGPTILQTRSKEDKDRVLTERIACILTGDDALTQVQHKTHVILQDNAPTILKSSILKKIEKLSDKLWDKSRLTKNFNDFYVEDLKFHFKPLNQQKSNADSVAENDINETNTAEQNHGLLNSSIVYEPMDIDIIIDQEAEKNMSKLSNNSESDKISNEFEFMKDFAFKWGDALNDSAASDLIIFVKNDKFIYVHKLVFHVQCPNLLLDIEPNNAEGQSRIKEKISWIEKEELASLAFLEFIYCGTIDKNIVVLKHNNLLSQVKQLARLYKVQRLFSYLRMKEKEIKSEELKLIEPIKNVNNDITILDDKEDYINIDSIKKNLSFQMQATQINDSLLKCKSDPLLRSDKKLSKTNDRRITASPDLFESEDDEDSMYLSKTQENQQIQELDNENQDDTDAISSQKTVVNLSGTTSSHNDVLVPNSPVRDIYGAITPKNQSPEIHNDITPEKIEYSSEEITEAVTPKANRSPKMYNDVISERYNYNSENMAKAVTQTTSELPDNNEIFKALTPESNSTPSNLIIEEEAQVEAIPTDKTESMYTAVTPPRHNEIHSEPELEIKDEKINKLKTDISLFIDKVRRINAKSVLDTDSETDTPEFRIKRKNPFLKQHRDDSYGYLRNDKHKQNEERRAISLLEEDILKGENNKVMLNQKTRDLTDKRISKNTESYDLSTSDFSNVNLSPDLQDECMVIDEPIKTTVFPLQQNLSISHDEIQNETVNESELSRYSKYKKQNKHNNSIEKYRKDLNLKKLKNRDLKQNNMKQDKMSNVNQDDNSVSEMLKNSLQEDSVIKSNPEIGDITLVSDSDDEELQIDKNTSHQEVSKQDGSVSKSNKKENESKLPSNTSKVSIQDDTIYPLELFGSHSKRLKASKNISSEILKDKSKYNVIDLSLDSDEESVNNDSTSRYRLEFESDNSLKRQKLNENNSYSRQIKQKEILEMSEKKNEDVDAEISKILQNSSEFIIQDERLFDKSKEPKNLKQFSEMTNTASCSKTNEGQREIINLSPISIISSPEMCESHEDKVHESNMSSLETKNENSQKSSMTDKKKLDHFNTFDHEFFDDIDIDDDWITKNPRGNSFINKPSTSTCNFSKSGTASDKNYLTNSSLRSPKNCVVQTSPISSLISSPILSQTRRKSRAPLNETDNIDLSKPRESKSTKQTRKLQTKSASVSNFSRENQSGIKSNLQRSTSFSTPTRNGNLSHKLEKSAKDMTPPPDYSKLSTPELHRKLRTFGLKPQNRNKATLLLTHIYNETHPVALSQKRSSSDILPDEDQAPPSKKQNLQKYKQNISKERAVLTEARTSQNCPIIGEEMDYDEADVGSIVSNPISIKDVFSRLLKTNKELYTQVLTYEPISLESLHLVLKQNGFKCKINALMDFLDEQCITFQCQTSKNNRLRKKARKK